eukprot:3931277-Amphidinium_carterae.1
MGFSKLLVRRASRTTVRAERTPTGKIALPGEDENKVLPDGVGIRTGYVTVHPEKISCNERVRHNTETQRHMQTHTTTQHNTTQHARTHTRISKKHACTASHSLLSRNLS